MLITFSGLDCSGKSTQIALLEDSFRKHNLQFHKIWSRGGYTPGFEYLKKILRVIFGKKLPSSGRGNDREKVISNPIVSRIWLSIAIIDLVFYYGFYIRYRSLFGAIIICDRYLGDTYLDFSLNFKHINLEKLLLWKLLVLVTPTPDKSFLISLSVNESIRRSKLKQDPFPETKQILEKRLLYYQDFSDFKGNNWHDIDGMQSIIFTNQLIKIQIFNKLSITNAP